MRLFKKMSLKVKLVRLLKKLIKVYACSLSTFFVPTFDTKVTEYLCSGEFFFLQTNFDFLTSHLFYIIQKVLLT